MIWACSSLQLNISNKISNNSIYEKFVNYVDKYSLI